MVKLEVARQALPSLIRSRTYVAVFVGGTSGIGEYTLQQLAKLYATKEGSSLRAYIVGRNSKAAERITTECSRHCPQGEFLFVQAEDLSLLKDVDRVCARIGELEREKLAMKEGGEPWIDLLVMSQACSVFQKQTDTSEGIDMLMSLLYYSRMRFVVNLLPFLRQSEPFASVISIYAAGTEDKLIIDDLPLQKPGNYDYFQARSHITFLKTMFFEEMAKQTPQKLSLIHVFPGLIKTPSFSDPLNPLWFKVVFGSLKPFLKMGVFIPPVDIGDRILYLATSRFSPLTTTSQNGPLPEATEQPAASPATAPSIPAPAEAAASVSSAPATGTAAVGTDGSTGSGAYAINDKGEPVKPSKAYTKIDKKQLWSLGWDHTMKVFSDIEKHGKFQG